MIILRSITLTTIFVLGSTIGYAQSQIVRPKTQKSATTRTTPETQQPITDITHSSSNTVLPAVARIRQAVSGKEIQVKGVTFKMMKVEEGTFYMGATPEQTGAARDEKPQHQVKLSSYYIGETEVSQILWKAVMGSNPSSFKGDYLPVESVSWNDCQVFISELNKLTGQSFRLPTEAEWEFAARGGNNSGDYLYSGSNILDSVAWHGDNSGGKPHNLKTKTPNELGIYDMSGNVLEWCQDWDGDYSANPVTNPRGAASGVFRVNRGGNWLIDGSNCRTANRGGDIPDGRYNYLGLRLAL